MDLNYKLRLHHCMNTHQYDSKFCLYVPITHKELLLSFVRRCLALT